MLRASVAVRPKDGGGCAYLGPSIVGTDGKQETVKCPTCRGAVYLKVFACEHPLHAKHPTTTFKDCKGCQDWSADRAGVVEIGSDPEMNHWRGGS